MTCRQEVNSDVRRIWYVYESSVYHLTVLSLSSRSSVKSLHSALLPKVTLNFLVTFFHFGNAVPWKKRILFIYWDKTTFPLPNPSDVIWSIVYLIDCYLKRCEYDHSVHPSDKPWLAAPGFSSKTIGHHECFCSFDCGHIHIILLHSIAYYIVG